MDEQQMRELAERVERALADVEDSTRKIVAALAALERTPRRAG